MLRVRNRRVDEASFEFAGQTVRLTSKETTLQLGRSGYAVAWTYRRPDSVSLGEIEEAHPIRDYGFAARAALVSVTVATYFIGRRPT